MKATVLRNIARLFKELAIEGFPRSTSKHKCNNCGTDLKTIYNDQITRGNKCPECGEINDP